MPLYGMADKILYSDSLLLIQEEQLSVISKSMHEYRLTFKGLLYRS